MYKHETIFILNNHERLVVSGEHVDEQCCCCCDTPAKFVTQDASHKLDTITIKSTLATFSDKLELALKNELKLDASIKQDIGYSYNLVEHYFHNDSKQVPGFKYERVEGLTNPSWVGYKYGILGTFSNSSMGKWLYNDAEGAIVFEIAPIYPWFNYCAEEDPVPEGYIPFEEWIKHYKPTLIRKIPHDVAKKWAAQAKFASDEIYALLERERQEFALRPRKITPNAEGMYTHEAVFALNEQEKLIVKGEHHQDLDCYGCESNLVFSAPHANYKLGRMVTRHDMSSFRDLLKQAIEGTLLLDASIKQDIGYLWNAERYHFYRNDLEPVPGFVYEKTQDNSEPQWVGNKYSWMIYSWLISSACSFGMWLYNDPDTSIVFEIAPLYPWIDYDVKKNGIPEGFVSWDDWTKDYKPTVLRKIPRDVAQRWLEQVQFLLDELSD